MQKSQIGQCAGVRLLAVGDLHVGFAENRAAVLHMRPHPEDWLVLVGDVGETEDHLKFVLDSLTPRFAQLVWVPGNHELWTLPDDPTELRGESKYRRLVEVCRQRGTLTPEDPYPVVRLGAEPFIVAPVLTLYDYSFKPDAVPLQDAVAWAVEDGVLCADERLLSPYPHETVAQWCRARVGEAESRLEEAAHRHRTILVSHFPLRSELAWLPRVPRFSIWCGTMLTQHWHKRFRAAAVVTAHTHFPRRVRIDGVPFYDVSFGYPRQWQHRGVVDDFLWEIAP